MNKSARANKLKKKNKPLDLKQLFLIVKGAKSPRLEMKNRKNSFIKSGSTYTTIIAKRDDTEIRGAIASLGNKSLEELKRKYKKYNINSTKEKACKEG